MKTTLHDIIKDSQLQHLEVLWLDKNRVSRHENKKLQAPSNVITDMPLK